MRARIRSWDDSYIDLEVCHPDGESKGVIVCGHAMMTDRRSLFRPPRPSLVQSLCEYGYTVVVPDLRGHGMSGPTPADGGDWSYDDQVKDAGVLLDYGSSLGSGAPVGLVGHSLFGHAVLAWLGRHPETLPSVSAVVLLGVNLWHPTSWGGSKSRLQIMLKTTVMTGAYALARGWGYLPVSRVMPKGMDEPTDYWSALHRCALEGVWQAEDGFDYAAALGQIRCPVLHVVSEGDPFYGNPEEAEHFLGALPERTFWRLGSPRCPEGLRGLSPNHMELVTRVSSQPLWDHVAQWLTETPLSEAQ